MWKLRPRDDRPEKEKEKRNFTNKEIEERLSNGEQSSWKRTSRHWRKSF
jgi:hypothetical protein